VRGSLMPIQLSRENGGKVLIVHVSGKLTKADYEHFVPELPRVGIRNWKGSYTK